MFVANTISDSGSPGFTSLRTFSLWGVTCFSQHRISHGTHRMADSLLQTFLAGFFFGAAAISSGTEMWNLQGRRVRSVEENKWGTHRKEHDQGVIYLLLVKIEDFSITGYWLVLFVILSVCLFECHSPTDHNFKPIFTKLHRMVEFVRSKKPIVYLGEKGQKSSKGQQICRISKILNFNPINLKFEEHLHIRFLISTTY